MPLGRGLSSLIPQKPIKTTFSNELVNQIDQQHQVLDIPVAQIQVNPHQPRTKFDHADLEELTESIKIYGIIQPLIATAVGDNSYQLIAGERRLRAAKLLNLPTVPVLIRQAKEQQKLELALIENVQRKNLNPIEQAVSYKRLVDEFNLTQEDVAKKIGKKRSTVANTLRLLELPEEVQRAILDEKISEGHARAIAALADPNEQKEFLRRILQNQLTVRQTEDQARQIKVRGHVRVVKVDPIVMEKEARLRDLLGHKVQIKNKGKGGEITIFYNSGDDLNSIYKRLTSLE